MGQLIKTVRFVVNTDAGGTGTSDTRTIEGIIQGFDLIYHASANANTDVYVRENDAGIILDVHVETDNATNKFATPSRDDPWIADGAFNVFVTGAGAALTAAVTVIARVVIG